MTSSTYSHSTSVDESKGIYDYDCSGFVGYALSRVLPSALASVEAASSSRPKAMDFEAFFAAASHPGWTQVGRVSDLRPGDVIAWLKPADVVSTNTGHMMIVADTPSGGSRADELLVHVIDSTSVPHGSTDSRTARGGNGLGTGTIGLLVDGSGRAIGYRWNGEESTKDEYTSIALGRVN